MVLTMSLYITNTASNNKKTIPACTNLSFTSTLRSWPIRLSMSSIRSTPPSKTGMGSKLKIPNWRLMKAISITSSGNPARYASPELRDPDRPGERASGHATCQNLPEHVKRHQAVPPVILKGSRDGGTPEQLPYDHVVVKRDSDAPAFLSHHIRENGCQSGLELPPVTKDRKLSWFPLARLQQEGDTGPVQNLTAIDAHNLVTGYESSLTRRKPRLDLIDNSRRIRVPAGVPNPIRPFGAGGEGHV